MLCGVLAGEDNLADREKLEPTSSNVRVGYPDGCARAGRVP
jgi:hypothetical protein